MKTLYPPRGGSPRPLTHAEVARVDAFSMGPADFHEQRHARYDPGLMRRLLEREVSDENLLREGIPLELDEETV